MILKIENRPEIVGFVKVVYKGHNGFVYVLHSDARDEDNNDKKTNGCIITGEKVLNRDNYRKKYLLTKIREYYK